MQDHDKHIASDLPSGSYASPDGLRDALAEADDVIAQALRRREMEEAIAETDREVAELAAARARARASSASAAEDPGRDKTDAGKAASGKTGAGKTASGKTDAGKTASGKTGSGKAASEEITGKADRKQHAGSSAAKQGSSAAGSSAAGSSAAGSSGPGNPVSGPSGSGPDKPGKKTGLLILLVLFAAVLTAGAAFLIQKYTPTSRRMSYTEYFGEMKDDEAAIVLQDHNLAGRAIVTDSGSVYLPYLLVRDSLNERFYWDSDRSGMLFTTPVQTFEIPINSTSYTVIDGALTSDPTSEASYREIIVLRDDEEGRTTAEGAPCMNSNEDGDAQASSDVAETDDAEAKLYISMNFLSEYTNVTCSLQKESQHLYLRNVWGDLLTATAAKDAAVRYQGGIKSPILTDLNKGDQVMVLGQTENWLRVLTIDGYIGYVKSGRMTAPAAVNYQNSGFTPQEYTSLAEDGKVSLIWQMVSGSDSGSTLENATAGMTGITVISPTWFSLTDNDGSVESIGSSAYVRKAHAMGLKVWGLVSDFSSAMDTSAVLASTTARRNCIGQLTGYAADLGLDGINLDFEYMEQADAYAYTQFVRELSIACRLSGLVLSVDLVPPYDFNSWLNRREIAEVCDYLVNMGYDEHYPGSEAAGSVASLSYEENAIRNLIAMGIPEKKIISAVPFYTRIWYTSTDADGTTYVNSEELSMSSVTATISSWNLTPVWDGDTAQNYVGWYTDDGVLCEIWIEDAQSLQRKLLLIPKYDLGGTAVWALGFEDSSVWPVLTDTLAISQEEAVRLEEQLIAEAATVPTSQTESET